MTTANGKKNGKKGRDVVGFWIGRFRVRPYHNVSRDGQRYGVYYVNVGPDRFKLYVNDVIKLAELNKALLRDLTGSTVSGPNFPELETAERKELEDQLKALEAAFPTWPDDADSAPSFEQDSNPPVEYYEDIVEDAGK